MTENRPPYTNCDGFTMPPGYSPEAIRSVINYKPKPDDLFIVTYPKCGTTWMQFIVMGILRKGKPIKSSVEFRFCTPFLEMAGIDAIDLMKEKGALKTHLPLRLSPFSSDAKYIYVARNPKDCCISYYHHTRIHALYEFEDGTFDEFFELFVNGKVDYEDYFDHLIPWYNSRNDPNVHFVTYEDMKKDIKSETLSVAKFIGDEYYEILQKDPHILEDIVRHSSLEYMKKVLNDFHQSLFNPCDPETNEDLTVPSGMKHIQEVLKAKPVRSGKRDRFVRKGEVGGWKSYFNSEQEKRMKEWIQRKTAESDVMNLWKDLEFD